MGAATLHYGETKGSSIKVSAEGFELSYGGSIPSCPANNERVILCQQDNR